MKNRSPSACVWVSNLLMAKDHTAYRRLVLGPHVAKWHKVVYVTSSIIVWLLLYTRGRLPCNRFLADHGLETEPLGLEWSGAKLETLMLKMPDSHGSWYKFLFFRHHENAHTWFNFTIQVSRMWDKLAFIYLRSYTNLMNSGICTLNR